MHRRSAPEIRGEGIKIKWREAEEKVRGNTAILHDVCLITKALYGCVLDAMCQCKLTFVRPEGLNLE